MEYFNQEYAELASDCNLGIQNANKKDKEIAELWTRSHNARNFVVFGDPAVRMAVSQPTSQSTDDKPIVWFKPSGTPSQSSVGNMSPFQTSGSTPEAKDRLIQLETQVKTLQAEMTSLQGIMKSLTQRLDRIERAD